MKFTESAGGAKKTGLDYFKLEMGENKCRMVGDLLARYCYWKKLKENNIPVECLGFDRKKERFTNTEKDWFKEYFPFKDNGDKNNCVWSYAIQVIDPKDNKLKLFGLKKKLFDQIMDLAKEIGDPTNTETGWDLIFEKKKTGPNRFNIEYKLKDRVIEVRALSEEELELIKDIKTIDELIPRPTPDEQHAFIKSAWLEGQKEEPNVDPAATDSFDDDIPF